MTYQLEKYKNRNSKHTCPQCGQPKCFTYYVDENGLPLDKLVGRCDHESGCGYHYPPKEYFKDHPDKEIPATHPPPKVILDSNRTIKPIDTVPMQYVTRSQSNNSHLIQFFFSLQRGMRMP